MEGAGITWTCLQAMDVPEFFDHVALARHRVASAAFRTIGQIQFVSPYSSREIRMAIHGQLQRDALFGCHVVDQYANAEGRDRLVMIGLALSSKGKDLWRKTPQGQQQMRWLAETSQTEADAVEAYQRWKEDHSKRIQLAMQKSAEGKRSGVVFQDQSQQKTPDR